MMKIIIFLLSYILICGQSIAIAQTIASILPLGVTQFFDNNGNPLSTGKVYFYTPNTLTFKTTWQNSGKTVSNTNPVTLDAAGRAIIYGDGTYRQQVKDKNGNLIWDAVTSSVGSGGSSTATGDGDLVGTIKPWAGLAAPNQYAFAYGQELSRTTYSVLFTALTSQQTITCTNGSSTASNFSDTSQIPIGGIIESICFAPGTTVVSKTTTTITFNNNANISTTDNVRLFLYGNGNGSTTFNVPDARGYTFAGRTNMGGSTSTNLTSLGLGTNPAATGAKGGYNIYSIVGTNLPAYTPTGTISQITPAGSINQITPTGTISQITPAGSVTTTVTNQGTGNANTLVSNGIGPFSATIAGGIWGTTALTASSSFSGTPVTPTFTGSPFTPNFTGTPVTPTFTGVAQGGTSVPFSLVQPTQTINYIIKITPDTNSTNASGVTSLSGMTGDVACGTGILCTGNTISSTLVTNDRSGYYYTQTYGAVCDGATDDTSHIQAAINAVSVTGGILYFQPGICIITAQLTVGDGSSSVMSTINKVTFQGTGGGYNQTTPAAGGTTIKWGAGANPAAIMLLVHGPFIGFNMNDISFEAQAAAGIGVELFHVAQSSYKNVNIVNFTAYGLVLTSYPNHPTTGFGCNNNLFENVSTFASSAPNAIGFSIGPTTASGGIWDCTDNTYINLSARFIASSNSRGIVLNYTDSSSFYNIRTSATQGVYIQDPSDSHGWPSGVTFYNLYGQGGIAASGTWVGSAVNFYNYVDEDANGNTPRIAGISGTDIYGTPWPVEPAGSIKGSPVRPRLTATLNLYARTDGNNTFCTGKTDAAYSSGSYPQNCAVLTTQKAVDIASGYDYGGQTININYGNEGAPKTFATTTVIQQQTGNGSLNFVGRGITNTIVNLGGSGSDCFWLSSVGSIQVNFTGMKVLGCNNAFNITYQSTASFGVMEFGAVTTAHINVHDAQAQALVLNGTITISGGAGFSHVFINMGGAFYENSPITISGTPGFTLGFMGVTNGGKLQATSFTFGGSGGTTGSRYVAQANGVINASGCGANCFPGNSGGSTGTGGQYIP